MQNIELFVADETDVEAKGRCSISLGHVGIRCVHCKHLSERPSGWCRFPKNNHSLALYKGINTMANNHFAICTAFPTSMLNLLSKNRPKPVLLARFRNKSVSHMGLNGFLKVLFKADVNDDSIKVEVDEQNKAVKFGNKRLDGDDLSLAKLGESILNDCDMEDDLSSLDKVVEIKHSQKLVGNQGEEFNHNDSNKKDDDSNASSCLAEYDDDDADYEEAGSDANKPVEKCEDAQQQIFVLADGQCAVRDSDEKIFATYTVLLLKQFVKVTATEEDLSHPNRRFLPKHSVGLTCRHCVDIVKERSDVVPKRYFFAKKSSFCNRYSEFQKHVSSCVFCPEHIREELVARKKLQDQERIDKKIKSNNAVLEIVWNRLSCNSDEGEGNVASPENDQNNKVVNENFRHSSNDEFITLLSLPDDVNILSPDHCFARRHLELFCVSEEEVDFFNSNKSIRNVTFGQIGIRCIHCSQRIMKRRDAEMITSGIIFPSKLLFFPHEVNKFIMNHFYTCEDFPKDEINYAKLLRQSNNCVITDKEIEYYAENAKKVGIFDLVGNEGVCRKSEGEVLPEEVYSSVAATSISNINLIKDSVPQQNMKNSSSLKNLPNGQVAEVIKNAERVLLSDDESSSNLVRSKDRFIGTDFSYLIMMQVKKCFSTEVDRSKLDRQRSQSNGKKITNDIQCGFSGLTCKHCSKRKWFYGSAKLLESKGIDSIKKHLMECSKCPWSIMRGMQTLQNIDSRRNSATNMQSGSVEMLSKIIWQRLHNNSADSDNNMQAAVKEEHDTGRVSRKKIRRGKKNDVSNNSLLTQADKEKKYSFVRKRYDHIECLRCNSVPLQFRSDGSTISGLTKPPVNLMKQHYETCKENMLNLEKLVVLALNMTKTIPGFEIKTLVSQSFSELALTLTGGNYELAAIFTKGVKAEAQGKKVPSEISNPPQVAFPGLVVRAKVVSALIEMADKNKISYDMVDDLHFIEFVNLISPTHKLPSTSELDEYI